MNKADANQITKKVNQYWASKRKAYEELINCLYLRYDSISDSEVMTYTKYWLSKPSVNVDVAVMLSDLRGSTDDNAYREFADKKLHIRLSDKASRLELFGSVEIRRANRVARKLSIEYQRNMFATKNFNPFKTNNRKFRDVVHELTQQEYWVLLQQELASMEIEYREKALKHSINLNKLKIDQLRYKTFVKYAIELQLWPHLDDPNGEMYIVPILNNLFAHGRSETVFNVLATMVLPNRLPESADVFTRLYILTTALKDSSEFTNVQKLQRLAILELNEDATQYAHGYDKRLPLRELREYEFFEVFQPAVMVRKLNINKDKVKRYKLVAFSQFINDGKGRSQLSAATKDRRRNNQINDESERQRLNKKVIKSDGELLQLLLHPNKTQMVTKQEKVENQVDELIVLEHLSKKQKTTLRINQLFLEYLKSDQHKPFIVDTLAKKIPASKDAIYRRLKEYWLSVYNNGLSNVDIKALPENERINKIIEKNNLKVSAIELAKVVHLKAKESNKQNK